LPKTKKSLSFESRKVVRDERPTSPRMFYEMAKRYDEWEGDDYEGSSARGAMKGWHKHGVCSNLKWPYEQVSKDRRLTPERIQDATVRPLGAYFRVNHKDLVSMHAALAEVGILYATATVHAGWNAPDKDGVIQPKKEILGGHAFAIVAYDSRGFWIQNSWGPDWGKDGFGLVSYDDWLANGIDVWVARLGVPLILHTAEGTATNSSSSARSSQGYSFHDLRPHIISIGNDGALRTSGTYGTSGFDVREILGTEFPRVTKNWKKKRLVLYAHGGLVGETTAIQRVADYRTAMLEREVYPLAFVWKTDYWTTLVNILQDALKQRRPEGLLDATKDFMLDRLDDGLEPLGRRLTGKAQWDEMKENAFLATTTAHGGARIVAEHLAQLVKNDPTVELHVVGHSAGSIFHGPVVQALTGGKNIPDGPMKGKRGLGLKIKTCTLWAPACTMSLFKEAYLPAIQDGGIGNFSLFTLADQAERDDNCGNIYHKSLLYLVSNAFEAKPRIPLFRDGEPILGMEKFVKKFLLDDPDFKAIFKRKTVQWVRSPNATENDPANYATARHHGDFDDDKPVLAATLARILQESAKPVEFAIHRSAASLKCRRVQLGSLTIA